jgi:hypothetical protein
VALLRRQDLQVSTSMVGRILTQLKGQGRLVEPSRSRVSGSPEFPVVNSKAEHRSARLESPAISERPFAKLIV